MPSNFRFTGAPKVAKYNPKGLDFFLAAPKLRAEVKGKAMRANEMARVDKSGLHSSDLKMADAMTDQLNSSREDITNSLLSSEPVDDVMISSIVKNFGQKKEVTQKLTKGLENAKRIEQYNQQMNAAVINGGDAAYLTKVREQSMSQWGGSWNPDGSMNEFRPAEAPQHQDLLGNFKTRAAVVMQNMEQVSPGSTDSLNLKMIPFKVAGGTQYMITYDKPTETLNNYDALDGMLKDFNTQLNNPETANGAMANFMQNEDGTNTYMDAIAGQIPGLMQDYKRTKTQVDPATSVSASKFVSDKAAKGKVTGEVARGQNTRIMHNNISVTKSGKIGGKALSDYDETLNEDGQIVNSYDPYHAGVDDDVMKMSGTHSTNVSEWDEAISPNIDNSALGEGATNIYNNTTDFRTYINKRLGEGNFFEYEDFKDARGKMDELGLTSFELTEKEANLTLPHTTGVLTSKQKHENAVALESMERSIEAKTDAYQSLTTMFNDFSSTQESFLFSSGIEFNVQEGDKMVNKEKDIMREVVSTLDSRVVLGFTENAGNNSLDLQYMSGADRNLQDKESIFAQQEAELQEGIKSGKYTKPRFVSNEEFAKYFPDVMKNADEATRKQIEEGTNGMYLFQKSSMDSKGKVDGPKEYIFVSAGNEIKNPANTEVTYKVLGSEDGEKTGSINGAVGSLGISDVLSLRAGSGLIEVKRKTDDVYVVNGGTTPYSKRTLLNLLYDQGL